MVEGGASVSNGMPVNDGTPTSEVYDFKHRTWTLGGEMHIGRTEHDATLLLDGTVLVTGGVSFPATSDLYHTSSSSFTETAGVLQPRQRQVALLLSNPAWGSLTGKVLIIGGASTGNSVFGGLERALDSVEMYDPATGQMSLFGTMTQARQNHTAKMLPDGRNINRGGVESTGIRGTAELHKP